MIPLLLWLLATLDAACLGFREAAGRDGRIRKRGYYGRALARGALWGQGAVLLAGLTILLLVRLSPAPAALAACFLTAGDRMLRVYLPYTACIAAALAARVLPSVDVRSLTSVLIFGPLVFLRPAVAVAGVAWAVAATRRWEVALAGALVLTMMLSLEALLARLRARRA